MTPLTPEQSRLVAEHAYMPRSFVCYRIRRMAHWRHLKDDLIQEGHLALCHAATLHDPATGAQFRTYAKHWIRLMVGELARSLLNPARAPRAHGASAGRASHDSVFVERGEMPLHDEGVEYPVADAIDAHRLYARAASEMTKRMNARCSDVFMRSAFPEDARGESLCENVGKELGMSRQAVGNMRGRGWVKFHEWAEGVRAEA